MSTQLHADSAAFTPLTLIKEFFDRSSGISFINNNSRVTLAVDAVENLTTYHFIPALNGSATAGLFDLVSNTGETVALFEDGHVGFVNERYE